MLPPFQGLVTIVGRLSPVVLTKEDKTPPSRPLRTLYPLTADGTPDRVVTQPAHWGLFGSNGNRQSEDMTTEHEDQPHHIRILPPLAFAELLPLCPEHGDLYYYQAGPSLCSECEEYSECDEWPEVLFGWLPDDCAACQAFIMTPRLAFRLYLALVEVAEYNWEVFHNMQYLPTGKIDHWSIEQFLGLPLAMPAACDRSWLARYVICFEDLAERLVEDPAHFSPQSHGEFIALRAAIYHINLALPLEDFAYFNSLPLAPFYDDNVWQLAKTLIDVYPSRTAMLWESAAKATSTNEHGVLEDSFDISNWFKTETCERPECLEYYECLQAALDILWWSDFID